MPMRTEPNPPINLLRLPVVEVRVGTKKSWIYAEMKAGRFPRCVHLGRRTVAWLESDIDDFIARLAARRLAPEGEV